MFLSALGSLGQRLDAKFVAAYFFPAFVAVLGTIAIVVRQAGNTSFIAWLDQFDSLQQGGIFLVLLLGTLMLAHLLQALERPIGRLYAGRAYPELVRRLLLPAQQSDRARIRLDLSTYQRGERLFPRDPADLAPTAFGNVVAASADYPRAVYGMDTYYWWPRLLPLLPADFLEALRSLETPMRMLLNLSLVSLYLGCLAGAIGMTHSDLLAAGVGLAFGLFFALVCYQAAIAQAVELARTIWVGFDLYRYEILKQLNEALPETLEAERALWARLGQRLQPLNAAPPAPQATASKAAAARSATPQAAGTTSPPCDPSYPDVCIPPPPPLLHCRDIPHRNFRVVPPDPHGFDTDQDGIGCETGARPS
jgi:hypothetical protein